MSDSFASLHIFSNDFDLIKNELEKNKDNNIPPFLFEERTQAIFDKINSIYFKMFQLPFESIKNLLHKPIYIVKNKASYSIFSDEFQLESIRYYAKKYFSKNKDLYVLAFGVFDGSELGLYLIKGNRQIFSIHTDCIGDDNSLICSLKTKKDFEELLNVSLDDLKKCFNSDDYIEVVNNLSRLFDLPINLSCDYINNPQSDILNVLAL